jgi:hypothetical protein
VVQLPYPGMRILSVFIMATSISARLAVKYLDNELMRRQFEEPLTVDERASIESNGYIAFKTETGVNENKYLAAIDYKLIGICFSAPDHQSTRGEWLIEGGRSPSWAKAQLRLHTPCRFLAMLCEAAACQPAKYVHSPRKKLQNLRRNVAGQAEGD